MEAGRRDRARSTFTWRAGEIFEKKVSPRGVVFRVPRSVELASNSGLGRRGGCKHTAPPSEISALGPCCDIPRPAAPWSGGPPHPRDVHAGTSVRMRDAPGLAQSGPAPRGVPRDGGRPRGGELSTGKLCLVLAPPLSLSTVSSSLYLFRDLCSEIVQGNMCISWPDRQGGEAEEIHCSGDCLSDKISVVVDVVRSWSGILD